VPLAPGPKEARRDHGPRFRRDGRVGYGLQRGVGVPRRGVEPSTEGLREPGNHGVGATGGGDIALWPPSSAEKVSSFRPCANLREPN
jgi:hypothetical protein